MIQAQQITFAKTRGAGVHSARKRIRENEVVTEVHRVRENRVLNDAGKMQRPDLVVEISILFFVLRVLGSPSLRLQCGK